MICIKCDSCDRIFARDKIICVTQKVESLQEVRYDLCYDCFNILRDVIVRVVSDLRLNYTVESIIGDNK